MFFLYLILILLALFVLFLNVVLILHLTSSISSDLHGAPYVPIPKKVARKALEMARVGKDDIFYDLGCGDGRVLVMALEEFGAKKAVGYEVSLWPYLSSKFKIQNSKLGDKIKIYRRDLFKADLSKATVVFLYLSARLVKRLLPKLSEELKPGSRVVTCRYPLEEKDGLKLIEEEKIGDIEIWVYNVRK